jgi:hypothetical protein
MTKTEALVILAAIQQREINGINIEQGLQLAVDSYIDNLLKENTTKTLRTIEWEFEKKLGNFETAFRHALKNKLKILRSKSDFKIIKTEIANEEKYIISKVAEKLEMTPQNLNSILSNHPEIKVIEVSARKRYLTKSEIEKVKRVGRKK